MNLVVIPADDAAKTRDGRAPPAWERLARKDVFRPGLGPIRRRRDGTVPNDGDVLAIDFEILRVVDQKAASPAAAGCQGRESACRASPMK